MAWRTKNSYMYNYSCKNLDVMAIIDRIHYFCFLICGIILCFVKADPVTNSSCSFHPDYCFHVEINTNLNSIVDVQQRCSAMFSGSWPIEIYNETFQTSVNHLLTNLTEFLQDRTVFLNLKSLNEGWVTFTEDQYESSDITIMNQNNGFVYLNLFDKTFHTDKQNSKKSYICSYKIQSDKCLQNELNKFDDLCFTLHPELKTWYEAQNECISKGGNLAIMRKKYLEITTNGSIPTDQPQQWWIGVTQIAMMWQRKKTMLTWTNFVPDIDVKDNDIIGFQINNNGNKWFVASSGTAPALMCMSDKNTFQTTSNNLIPKTPLSTLPQSSSFSNLSTFPGLSEPAQPQETTSGRDRTKLGIGLGVGLSSGLLLLLAVSLVIWIKVFHRKCLQPSHKDKPNIETNGTDEMIPPSHSNTDPIYYEPIPPDPDTGSNNLYYADLDFDKY